MEKNREEIFKRMGYRWAIKPAFLQDVYFLMLNDLRFNTSSGGIRYTRLENHLRNEYGFDIKERQLRYLVCLVKKQKPHK